MLQPFLGSSMPSSAQKRKRVNAIRKSLVKFVSVPRGSGPTADIAIMVVARKLHAFMDEGESVALDWGELPHWLTGALSTVVWQDLGSILKRVDGAVVLVAPVAPAIPAAESIAEQAELAATEQPPAATHAPVLSNKRMHDRGFDRFYHSQKDTYHGVGQVGKNIARQRAWRDWAELNFEQKHPWIVAACVATGQRFRNTIGQYVSKDTFEDGAPLIALLPGALATCQPLGKVGLAKVGQEFLHRSAASLLHTGLSLALGCACRSWPLTPERAQVFGYQEPRRLPPPLSGDSHCTVLVHLEQAQGSASGGVSLMRASLLC